jgi:hypothetical protein
MPTMIVALASALLAVVPHLVATEPPPVGVWRGESVCLARKPICKDEIVVYHFTPTSADSTRLSVRMDKTVNGVDEEMATLDCTYARATAALVCEMAQGVWRFTRTGDRLDGRLVLRDGTVGRRIAVRRAGS